MAQPRVSIIVPVYNAEPYLRETLDSVFAQTLPDFELITVDDGSTDSSLDILREYEDAHSNMVVESIPNSGAPGRPRNVALDLARGEYVFFLDADDVLAADVLERAVETADDTGSDIVLVRMENFGTGVRGVPRFVFKKERRAADFIKSYAYRTLSPVKLFRRSLIEEHNIRFPLDYPVGEDQPFVLAAYLNGNHISTVSDKVYYWVRNLGTHDANARNTHATPQSPRQDLDKAIMPMRIVAEHMKGGKRRDTLLERFLIENRGFPWAFNRRFLELDEATQNEFIRIAAEFAPLWSARLRAKATEKVRLLVDAIFSGDRQHLVQVIERISKPAVLLEARPAGLRSTLLIVEGSVEPTLEVRVNGKVFREPARRLTARVASTAVRARAPIESFEVEFIPETKK